VATVYLYGRYGNGWLLFALVILAPDISMTGYVAGPWTGAIAYNIGHTTVLPLGLAVGGVIGSSELVLSVALVWLAHIGMDRMMGFGLKRASGFGDTHLGRIGRGRTGSSD
jgi:membrane protein implicated in regulation of membrane protease activity